MADTRVGGYGPIEKATEETQKLCDQVKRQVEEKTGECYEEYIAVAYRVQVVAGTNYLIKVHVGGSCYIHLIVFKSLPCDGEQVSFINVKEYQTKTSPLVPF